jgi:hypothetical protein
MQAGMTPAELLQAVAMSPEARANVTVIGDDYWYS